MKDEQLTRIPQMFGLLFRAALQRGIEQWGDWPELRFCVRDQRVDKKHLNRYLNIIGCERDDAYMPIAYAQVLSFPLQLKILTDKQFPFKAMGLVHIENTIEQYKSIPSDATYVLRCCLGALQKHAKGLIFSLETTVEVMGEIYWRGVAVYLRRDEFGLSAKVKSLTEYPQKKAPIDVGMPKRASIEIKAGLGWAYAVVARDMNPIHITTLSARFFGFKRPIVHGMWSMARVAEMLELEGDRVSLTVRFLKPIQIPSATELFADPIDGTTHFELKGLKSAAIHMTGSFSSL